MNFSDIIIGCMRWGIWGADFNVSQVQKMIEAALLENLYTFDHADIYGGYTTEALFGKALNEMNIEREKIQLISKCGIELPGGSRNYDVKSYNYSKEYILNSVDQSLQNLGTEYLDVLLLHRPSPLLNPIEVADAFSILKENGKVKAFGVSNFSSSQFSLLEQYFPDLVTNQIEVSVNHVDAFYDGTLDQQLMKNIRPMAWSVMGNYFSDPSTAQNLRIKNVLSELCSKYSVQENQLLLAFVLRHPSRIIPIVGTSKPENFKVFKESLNINLDRVDWFRILEAIQGNPVP